ncbi:SRPBCC family protein [Actinospongicola halichondriae]|uniref:SRPBCC family protein n=1 Tax=Actinospongicola halichondriae TaxID=3236844 RepID=UPI003D4076DC
MDITATLDATCTAEELYRWVGSLDTYDQWLEIVPRTESAPEAPGDPGPAWFVTLRGKLGPLARSKRLRMVRTAEDAPGHVRFERRETDGREHAAWVLSATVTSEGPTSTLTMDLHYGGTLWVPLLDRLLTSEIEASRSRLRALATPS